MTRHMLESIGISACHSIDYAEESGGRTLLLSKTLVLSQVWGLALSLGIDAKAQACHALGAGIIENDLPHIPFEQTWRSRPDRNGEAEQ